MALTPRERQVMELVAGGLPDSEIAQRMCIEIVSVKAHLQNIFSDLGVNTRTAAAAIVWRERIAVVEAERDELRQRWQDMERYAKLTAREYRGLCNGEH